MGHAIAGSAGAALSNVVTYPLSLIITRQQTQSRARGKQVDAKPEYYTSLHHAAAKIYNEEGGLSALYTGLVPDTSKTIVDSFLFFLTYTYLRQRRLRHRNAHASHLSVADELSVGFFAGAFSKFLTTPIANVVTRQQAIGANPSGRTGDKQHEKSFRSILQHIQTERGLRGFWSGYTASLVLTLNPSFTFFFFEALKQLLLPRDRRSDPSSETVFLLAATSKALASAITYPFSLAKSRIQSSTASTTSKATKQNGLPQGSAAGNVRLGASKNVISTVSDIVNQEGAGALYAGLWSELFKGFFSHGITMIMKDAVHKVILQLYYAILKFLNRRPSLFRKR